MRAAVVLPLRTVTGDGVMVAVAVASATQVISSVFKILDRRNELVRVAVVAGAVDVDVDVGQSAVFVSVMTRGCGSGARSTSARRAALSSTKRSFSCSSSSRRTLPLKR
jgi:hypothetical protein